GDAADRKDAEGYFYQQKSLQTANKAITTRQLYQVQQGQVGVDFAVMNNALRAQNQLSRVASRNVQNRNVVDVGGLWNNGGFNPKMEAVTVKAHSEAYFDILKAHAEVKDVYTLGNYVIWVTPSGKALIIDLNAGLETMPEAAIQRLFTAPPKAEN